MHAHRTSLAGTRVLVTGGGGFIGAALVKRLVDKGAHVTALARRPGRLDPDATAYRFVSCDLRSVEQTRAVVNDTQPQVVFHLAAQPDGTEDVSRLQAMIGHNITAVGNLLEAVVDLPSLSLVYGDSLKVYGNGAVPFRSDQRLEPLSTYAVSKQAGWSMIDVYRRVHGLRAVGLRPSLVYGPNQTFNLFTYLITAVMSSSEEILLDGGAQTRDPLYIDDAVSAFVAAAEHISLVNGMNLPIGGNRETSVADIAAMAVRLLGGRQKIVVRPASVRPTEMLRSWCDNAEATALLGWAPQVDLEEGILRTARVLHPKHSFASRPMQHESA